MGSYYSQTLSGEKLRLCYEVAPPRVQQYLEAEIVYVLAQMESSYRVLELGCGYGRVLTRLAAKADTAVGIDTSYGSLRLAQEVIGKRSNSHLLLMDAVEMGFRDRRFDMVICIQNGISAFRVDQRKLIEEALRVTRAGGKVLFSSYSDRFWEDRLDWFRIQSQRGLIGEIDEDTTGSGAIVCKDGFTTSTVRPDDFILLTSYLGIDPIITEVDHSSIFYELLN
jgi:SAM-dependent methyltransferase